MSEGAAEQASTGYLVATRPAERSIQLSPRLRWRAFQALADFATVVGAALATYGVYLLSGVGRQHYEPGLYLQITVAFATITVFALHVYGTYRSQMGLLRVEAVQRILHGVSAGLLLTLGLSFLVQVPGFSRLNVLLWGPAIVLALVTQRFVMWKAQDRRRNAGLDAARVLVYGAGETGRLLAQHLLEEHGLGLKAVGFLDDNPELRGENVRVGAGVDGERIPVMGGEDDLEQTIAMTRATAVFLAMPSASSQRIAEIAKHLEARRICYFFVPTAGELLFSGLQFGQVAGIPVFRPRRLNADPIYDAAKRAVDVIGASLLLLLTSPLLAFSALLVRLSSRGPVLFTQERVGLDGERFTIYKLRTMGQDSPQYALHPSQASDPRITPVGRWLRRLSIDELPQLWNVLRGEMSLVGPRPEMPFVVAKYDDNQRQRLAVKPGVTGLWQISADRAFHIHDNIHYDLYYVENRCLAVDLSILLMTPFVFLEKNRAM